MLLFWLGCIVFVAIGVFMFHEDTVMAILAVAFFGLGVFIFPIAIFHKKSGLYITPQGIRIITPFANDFVGWDEIEGFDVGKFKGGMIVGVFLKNPDLYLQKQSKWKKWNGGYSMNVCGTPYTISTNAYQTDAEDLCDLLISESKKYKTP